MADISKCANEDCPSRKNCYRATAKDSKRQSYSKFEFKIVNGAIKCQDYFPNEVNENDNTNKTK